ncbi:hypothetical protein PIB30_085097 [Stylosanthes scabra]|uniref:Uncharacterized protein n=1 Tax=Stylosanthes scabra TaxID=79078 RepID=A0ABU6RSL9_9FABA|nr:hypothetical protein [Stylosanthes scabra]
MERRENERRMKEREGRTVFKCRSASRGRAMPITRARPQMGGPKALFSGLTRVRLEWNEHATLPVANPRAPSARVQTRQEEGAKAPCNLVASAECGQAHRTDSPRPSRGRARLAYAPLRWCGRAVAPVMKNLAISGRVAVPPGDNQEISWNNCTMVGCLPPSTFV